MDLSLIIALATMGGLGFFFAGALALADKKLSVEEDPRVVDINEILPGANCGACGKAGCYDFAVKVVDGQIAVTGCPIGGQETSEHIARILGVDAGDSVRMVARVLCRGGEHEAANKSTTYNGPWSCAAMALVSGGDKQCLHGCLGGGDCVEACQFDAMIMDENGMPQIIDELCKGCGACVTACPRDVVEMHPEDREIFVFCKNHDDPKTAKKVCVVACIGCGICARKSDGSIVMEDKLAIIDYERLQPELIPFEKCTTGAIGYINQTPEQQN
jgi:H+/Na+-translocating ferredoxin:NAD+ oxidoreductase subunit B